MSWKLDDEEEDGVLHRLVELLRAGSLLPDLPDKSGLVLHCKSLEQGIDYKEVPPAKFVECLPEREEKTVSTVGWKPNPGIQSKLKGRLFPLA